MSELTLEYGLELGGFTVADLGCCCVLYVLRESALCERRWREVVRVGGRESRVRRARMARDMAALLCFCLVRVEALVYKNLKYHWIQCVGGGVDALGCK